MRFRKVRLTQPLMILLLNKALGGRLPEKTVITGVHIDQGMNLEFILYSERFKRLTEVAEIPYVDDASLGALLEAELDRG